MGLKVNTRHLGPVALELGTRVRWHADPWLPGTDEHDGDTGTLCQNGDNGPTVIRFNDLCERYTDHGIVEVAT